MTQVTTVICTLAFASFSSLLFSAEKAYEEGVTYVYPFDNTQEEEEPVAKATEKQSPTAQHANIGTAQVTARHWLDRDSKLSREQAIHLVTTLAWRGLSSFPRSEEFFTI